MGIFFSLWQSLKLHLSFRNYYSLHHLYPKLPVYNFRMHLCSVNADINLYITRSSTDFPLHHIYKLNSKPCILLMTFAVMSVEPWTRYPGPWVGFPPKSLKLYFPQQVYVRTCRFSIHCTKSESPFYNFFLSRHISLLACDLRFTCKCHRTPR